MKQKNTKLPYYPSDDDSTVFYTPVTTFEHLVAEYAGISVLDVQDLDYIDYLILRRDAFIHLKMQTEEGREWLENAWRCEQTEPERDKLREKYGRKE